MAWIETVSTAEAKGQLARVYDAAVKRAGKIYRILTIQSVNARVLDGSIELYRRIMHGSSPLSRAQREMIAVVVPGE